METYLFKLYAKAFVLCLLLVGSSCEKDDASFTHTSQNAQSNSVSFEVISKTQLPQHKTLSKTLMVDQLCFQILMVLLLILTIHYLM